MSTEHEAALGMVMSSYERLLIVMQASYVAAEHDGPEAGMEWITNCLDDPGILPGPDDDGGNWDGNESAQDFYTRNTRPQPPTPPLVASPSPVVPDSEALDGERVFEGNTFIPPLTDDEKTGLLSALDELHGSGVVPDKPALAPYEYVPSDLLNEMFDAIAKSNAELWYRAAGAIRQSPVPAVTDDEAATKAEAAGGIDQWDPPWYVAGMGIWHDDDGLPLWKAQSYARAAVAALRSAGFLIVHHTKET